MWQRLDVRRIPSSTGAMKKINVVTLEGAVSYKRTMDADHRIVLLPDICKRLAEEREKYLVLVPGPPGCVLLYPDSGWNEMLLHLKSTRSFRAYRVIARHLISGSLKAFPDDRGRITLYASFVHHARLRNHVLIRKEGDHAVISNPNRRARPVSRGR